MTVPDIALAAAFIGPQEPDEWTLPTAGGSDPLWHGSMIIRSISTEARLKKETFTLEGIPYAYRYGDRSLRINVVADQLHKRGLPDTWLGRVSPSSLGFISPMCGMSLAAIHEGNAGLVLLTGVSREQAENAVPRVTLSLEAEGVYESSDTSTLPISFVLWTAGGAPPPGILGKYYEWQVPVDGTVNSWVSKLPVGLSLQDRGVGAVQDWWVQGTPIGDPRQAAITLTPTGPVNALAARTWSFDLAKGRRQIIALKVVEGIVLDVNLVTSFRYKSRIETDSYVEFSSNYEAFATANSAQESEVSTNQVVASGTTAGPDREWVWVHEASVITVVNGGTTQQVTVGRGWHVVRGPAGFFSGLHSGFNEAVSTTPFYISPDSPLWQTLPL